MGLNTVKYPKGHLILSNMYVIDMYTQIPSWERKLISALLQGEIP